MKTCNICQLVFEKHTLYANHIRWYHSDTPFFKEVHRKSVHAALDRRFGKEKEETRICKTCNTPFTVVFRSRRPKKGHCSQSCANKGKKRTEKAKEHLRELQKQRWLDPAYREKMMGREQPRQFSSKGERELRARLNEIFDNKFTHGGYLKVSETCYVQRDCYSSALKICVEYDGACHFIDMYGQLKKNKKKINN